MLHIIVPPGGKSGVHWIRDRCASATVASRPLRLPQTLSCVRSTHHKTEPNHFILGIGVTYGKFWIPIDFGVYHPIDAPFMAQKPLFWGVICTKVHISHLI